MKGFHENPRGGKNDSLSQIERKTTQRKGREPGSAPKVRFQESMFTGGSQVKPQTTLYMDREDAAFSLSLRCNVIFVSKHDELTHTQQGKGRGNFDPICESVLSRERYIPWAERGEKVMERLSLFHSQDPHWCQGERSLRPEVLSKIFCCPFH